MNDILKANGLINALDMKEYSKKQSDKQLKDVFCDLYDELLDNVWEIAHKYGKTELMYQTKGMSCDEKKSIDRCINILDVFINKGYNCIITRVYIDCIKYFYKIYLSWSGYPPNIHENTTINIREKIVFSSYLN